MVPVKCFLICGCQDMCDGNGKADDQGDTKKKMMRDLIIFSETSLIDLILICLV